jgi:hypothetical protein
MNKFRIAFLSNNGAIISGMLAVIAHGYVCT